MLVIREHYLLPTHQAGSYCSFLTWTVAHPKHWRPWYGEVIYHIYDKNCSLCIVL